MKAKLNRFIKTTIILLSFFCLLAVSTNQTKAQAPICPNNSSFIRVDNISSSGDQVTATVTGCIVEAGSFEIAAFENGTANLIGTQTGVDAGPFSDTLSFSAANNIYYLDIVVRSTSGNNIPARVNAVEIEDRTNPPDPENANLDLTNTFLGGAGSDTQIKDIYASPANLVNLIIRNLFVFAGLILFFNILWAGFKFITQEAKGKDEAKSIMTVSIVGFILMFVAYWIVQIIGVVTGMELVQ